MQIIKTIATLKNELNFYKLAGKKIGFVPTMGALHEGHLSLIKRATEQNEVSVCSIFVNPTQFNNVDDFNKYPITLDADIELLEKTNCTLLFLPTVAEMYPPDEVFYEYRLGDIETILEGKYRPGHFQGVCVIVDKLLEAVKPTVMYLGRKDYQQCMVIQTMMYYNLSEVKLVICETVREPDGLAMSSRNKRLNAQERLQAVCIITALKKLQQDVQHHNIEYAIIQATLFLKHNGFKVDYIAVADAETLLPITNWDKKNKAVALVAAYLNEVRLIDNINL